MLRTVVVLYAEKLYLEFPCSWLPTEIGFRRRSGMLVLVSKTVGKSKQGHRLLQALSGIRLGRCHKQYRNTSHERR